jgi:hypothetical protein
LKFAVRQRPQAQDRQARPIVVNDCDAVVHIQLQGIVVHVQPKTCTPEQPFPAGFSHSSQFGKAFWLDSRPSHEMVMGESEIVGVANVEDRWHLRHSWIPIRNPSNRDAHPHDDLKSLDVNDLISDRYLSFFRKVR